MSYWRNEPVKSCIHFRENRTFRKVNAFHTIWSKFKKCTKWTSKDFRYVFNQTLNNRTEIKVKSFDFRTKIRSTGFKSRRRKVKRSSEKRMISIPSSLSGYDNTFYQSICWYPLNRIIENNNQFHISPIWV